MSSIFLFLIGVVLPLYHREGFVMIGDRKYLFFLTVSVLLAISFIIDSIRQQLKGTFQTTSFDGAAIFYGVAVLVSTYFSAYPETAVWGYSDWHMGMMAQLLFLVIFAAASRLQRGRERLVTWMLRSAMVVFFIGVCNRFSIDPLRMFTGLEYWNRTHLLSTVGNINWYSGYMILMFSIGYGGYLVNWNTEDVDKPQRIHSIKETEWITFLIVGFATILTQGSESGLLSGGALLLVGLCYAVSTRQRKIVLRVQKSFIVLALTGLMLSFVSVFVPSIRNFADDSMTEHILKPIYWIVILVVVLLFRVFLVKWKTELVMRGMLAAGLICFLGVAWNLRSLLREWGSGRDWLWRVTMQGYLDMPLKNKLFGAGPDCFAPYMYERYSGQMDTILSGWWGDAVIANAHNELLNRLICTGAVGCLAFVWLIGSAIVLFYKNRNENKLLIPLAIGLLVTMVHQTAGFQHIMLTPFVFLVMGIGVSCINYEQNKGDQLS